MKSKPWLTWAIILLAAGIRLAVGYFSYPLTSDAPHFVQHGVAMAHGHEGALNERWSQIPQYAAALAVSAGLDPGRAVQALTLLAGILAVPLFMRLLTRWTGSAWAGLIGGAWLATSQPMIEYSVNSMGEMSFLCLLLAALNCMPGPWLDPAPSWKQAGGAYLALGLGLGFRPPESVISMALLSGHLGVAALLRKNGRLAGKMLMGLAIFAGFAFPLMWVTRLQTGMVSTSSKIDNIAYGVAGYDSKVIYGWGNLDEQNPMYARINELKSAGPAVFLWRHRGEIARRWFANMMVALRHVKNFLFSGAFSMGTGWFAILLAICAVGVGRAYGWTVPGRMGIWAVVMPSFMALSFVHPRWIVPWCPFAMALFAAGLAACCSASRYRRIAGVALAGIFVWQGWQGAWAVDTWVEHNSREVARELRQLDSAEAIVSSVRPVFAVEYYQDNPLLWRNQPYGEIPEVLAYADREHIQYLLVQSAAYPHWPIQRLREGLAPVPAGWEIVLRREFTRTHPRWGEQTDQYLVIGRSKHPNPTQGTTP